MKGFTPLLLGIFATLAFSWLGLAYIPNLQIGHLEPQSDEEGTDIYPMPKSGMAERGHRVYIANGCFYCHSQQVRADYAGADIERKWGDRRSAPRDYIFDRPVEIGRMRLGPDLSNIGKRAPAEENAAASPAPAASAAPGTSPAISPAVAAATTPTAPTPAGTPPKVANVIATSSPSPAAAAATPAGSPAIVASAVATASPSPAAAAASVSPPTNGAPAPYSAAWHYQHLYAPRSLSEDSNMPAYRFLYEKRHIGGQPSSLALKLTGHDAPPEGFEIVPTYDAQCLVAYLMSLDQSHPLKEVKSTAAAASPAAAKK